MKITDMKVVIQLTSKQSAWLWHYGSTLSILYCLYETKGPQGLLIWKGTFRNTGRMISLDNWRNAEKSYIFFTHIEILTYNCGILYAVEDYNYWNDLGSISEVITSFPFINYTIILSLSSHPWKQYEIALSN